MAKKSTKEATLKARRRLSELYARGVGLRFDGSSYELGPFEEECPEGHVEVWIAPPNPLQREEALRQAQAKRSLALVRIKDKDIGSPDYLTAQAFVAQMDNETLLDYVLLADQDARNGEARRAVLSQEEWEDVSAMQDALRHFADLEAKGELDPEDEDFKTLMKRDAKFAQQVRERENELTDAARQAMRMLSRDALERRALDKRSELVASQSFMREYERQMSFYAVREADDHDELFFEDPEELASMPDKVQQGVSDALASFIQDGSEAKN